MPGIALLQWYGQNARPLPWRKDGDPYRVWVSEVMLQQTRVEAVLPRYEAFLRALPNVGALAEAPEETLNKLWEGLGYYSRAANLQRAARQIVELGRFPDTVEGLRRLRGFGPYTAGAVASIAFQRRAAAVDGNVLRIHARMRLDDSPLPSPLAAKAAEAWVLRTMPASCKPGDFNQALMDLGALVCTPLSPRCSRCPWTPWCLAFEQALQDAYPKRLPKPVRQEESFPVFLLFQAGRVLVRKRPPSGMLAGLWEFPHHVDLQAAGDPLCAHRHVFTHRVGNMQLVLALPPREPLEGVFVDAEGLRALPMASAFAPFRERALHLMKES